MRSPAFLGPVQVISHLLSKNVLERHPGGLDGGLGVWDQGLGNAIHTLATEEAQVERSAYSSAEGCLIVIIKSVWGHRLDHSLGSLDLGIEE